MGPPLQFQESSFVEVTKAITKAAWNVSEVAATLTEHQNAAVTPDIKDALFRALAMTATELYTVHGQVVQLAYRVGAVGGLMLQLSQGWGHHLYDGGDYDMYHNKHPLVLNPPSLRPGGLLGPPLGPFTTFGPHPKLPGEL